MRDNRKETTLLELVDPDDDRDRELSGFERHGPKTVNDRDEVEEGVDDCEREERDILPEEETVDPKVPEEPEGMSVVRAEVDQWVHGLRPDEPEVPPVPRDLPTKGDDVSDH